MNNLGVIKRQTNKRNFDQKSSIQLGRALQRVGRCKKLDVSQWATHFEKLRRVDGVEEDQITKVLAWFIEYVRDKYTPKVFSAKGFRDKFFKIEYAMSKSDDEFKDFRVTIIKETNDEEIFEIDYEN